MFDEEPERMKRNEGFMEMVGHIEIWNNPSFFNMCLFHATVSAATRILSQGSARSSETNDGDTQTREFVATYDLPSDSGKCYVEEAAISVKEAKKSAEGDEGRNRLRKLSSVSATRCLVN